MRKIPEIMELVIFDPLPSWEVFSSVVLLPLRVQMMGSVVMGACVIRYNHAVAKPYQGCSCSIITHVTAG